jgi:hypothetical protein
MFDPIGGHGSLQPYYGTRGATYFQQMEPVHLGDSPYGALEVQGEAGLRSQAVRRRGSVVSVVHFPLYPVGALLY